MARYLGFDGFRRGWVAAWIEDDGSHGFTHSENITELLTGQFTRAMIDIPIGLPDAGYRQCDIDAQQRVRSSVFTGARRNVWKFATQNDANNHYWANEGPGKGISCQLWNIREKIRQVDDFITPEKQRKICETHPELIFWARNGGSGLDKKKSEAGRAQRVEILKRLGFTTIDVMLMGRFGTGIGRDDLIDACACAIAARDAKLVLGNDVIDARGLRMEMHF